jgi:hypothetical protein
MADTIRIRSSLLYTGESLVERRMKLVGNLSLLYRCQQTLMG